MLHNNRGSALAVLGTTLLVTSMTGLSMAEGPAISGYVDTQWGYNFSKPNTGMTSLRSYDAQDNTIANTAHISLVGEFGEGIGYAVELDAGRDAAATVGGTVNASGVVLQEAHLTYGSPSGFGFKVGKFATFHGIEVIESPANPTITRGYLFGLGEPFTHVGGMLTYAVGKLDFGAGVINGWDQANDNNQGKTVVGKIGLDLGDTLTACLSAHHGPEQNQVLSSTTSAIIDGRSGANRDSVDLTLLTKIIPRVDLYLQGLYGSESQVVDLDGDGIIDDRANFSGAGIQPVINFTDNFSLGGRLEYFADGEGGRTGTVDNFMTNFTLTPGYKITENIQARGEYRYDKSNKKIFVDDKGKAEDTNSSIAFQVIITY